MQSQKLNKNVNWNVKETFFIFGCIWLNKIVTFRSSHQRCSSATLLKKRPWHRCFPANFVKFLKTPFLQNNSGGCFCCSWKQDWEFLTFSESYKACQAEEGQTSWNLSLGIQSITWIWKQILNLWWAEMFYFKLFLKIYAVTIVVPFT